MIYKYKIIWSPKAYKDLKNIYFYIKDYLKETNVANKLVKTILNNISNLSYFPEKYMRIKNYGDKVRNIRRMHIFNYNVIYEVNTIR